MSKKLLKESTIRRFGGLAGIKPISTAHFLSEMGEMTYEPDEEDAELDGAALADDDLAMDEPAADETEFEDEIEEPIEADAEGLVMSLLGKVKEWASEQNIEIELEGEGEEAVDMGVDDLPPEVDGDLEDLDTDLDDDLDDDLAVDAVEFEEEEETLEEMINGILSEEEEELEEKKRSDATIDEPTGPASKKGDENKRGTTSFYQEGRARRISKGRATANEARRRTKQTKRAKSRGVKVEVVSDEKVIQEVTKRVKNRLARIAKARKNRS